MKVLIAGAGIGGLTAALCCLHFGHDVEVHERAAELGEVGAGIQLPPNAMKVFAALGLSDALVSRAFAPQALEARMGQSGRQIFNIPLTDAAAAKWGAPYLHIHRADYIDVLKRALMRLAPQALRLNSQIVSYQQDEIGVTAELSSGAFMDADILIGADGIRSTLRRQVVGEDEAKFTGNVAWRAVVPISELGEFAPDPSACVWMGKGRHAVTYLIRGGALANFVGVVERTDWQGEGWSERGTREEALRDFAGWHPTIARMIRSAPEDGLYSWALFDRPPLSRWTDHWVALLGDAAHPMLPFFAQGAAMAVEDAWVLAREISEPQRTPVEALKIYEAKRAPRAGRVQDASRANMKTFHRRSRAGQLATYGPMWLGGHILPNVVRGRLNWLYGYDATRT